MNKSGSENSDNISDWDRAINERENRNRSGDRLMKLSEDLTEFGDGFSRFGKAMSSAGQSLFLTGIMLIVALFMISLCI